LPPCRRGPRTGARGGRGAHVACLQILVVQHAVPVIAAVHACGGQQREQRSERGVHCRSPADRSEASEWGHNRMRSGRGVLPSKTPPVTNCHSAGDWLMHRVPFPSSQAHTPAARRPHRPARQRQTGLQTPARAVPACTLHQRSRTQQAAPCSPLSTAREESCWSRCNQRTARRDRLGVAAALENAGTSCGPASLF